MVDQADLILRQAGLEVLRGIGVAVLAGQKLYGVMPGDTVKVTATVDYRGPELDDHFYAAIGNQVVVFDEVWSSVLADSPIHFDADADWVTYTLTANIPITRIANMPWTPGWFDIYVKINGHPGAGMPLLANVIEVLLEPEFQNFGIVSYETV